jgi:hypothetical protein
MHEKCIEVNKTNAVTLVVVAGIIVADVVVASVVVVTTIVVAACVVPPASTYPPDAFFRFTHQHLYNGSVIVAIIPFLTVT